MPNILSNPSNNVNITLKRLHLRLNEKFSVFAENEPETWSIFISRFNTHFPRLFDLLFSLYSDQYDFFYYLEELALLMAKFWINRPEDLKALDQQREKTP